MAEKDGTKNLGLGNRDREVEELLDIQDDTKIEKQGGSVATGAIPNGEWAHQTSSIINMDLVSEDVNARHKDVMVTGRQAGVYQNTQLPTKRRAAYAPKVTLEENHHSIKHPGYPSSLINQQPPIHDREAVSEEDVGNSRQENILMMGQDTNSTATSRSDTTMQLAPRCTTLEENAIIRMQNLEKKLFSLKHDLRKKSEELVHVTTQAEECRSRCAQLEEQMEEECRSRCARLEEQMEEECRSRCARLEEQMEERGIENESYAIRISNLQRRNEELQSHVVEIGIAMADKNETIRIQQEECDRLRERVPVPILEDDD